ncbi:voltage-dependent calcium channel gamma-like subunit isoform X2 [Chanos chanos]|uniref:Voltage-dependent calcium channel gamma-like subunit isoform X2 n=1 Tax=Chanos chanos TaxID=29144 RepID=A0A6J2WFL6_CHACN|nr:voltage-dependent calcium channel gamma-like subunit isoform X2 [Chanos chanos]
MTAIKIRVMELHFRKSEPLFLEVLTRSLIILCAALAIMLSSAAVCDGHWLLSGDRMYGLWNLCVLRADRAAAASLNCTTNSVGFGTEGLGLGLAFCRSVVSLAVVAAIFGLEMLLVSQASEGSGSSQRWSLGSALLLLAAGLASAGVVSFVFTLGVHASPLGFTLTFWCQFAATFLFFLNGLAARHYQNLKAPLMPSGNPGKV